MSKQGLRVLCVTLALLAVVVASAAANTVVVRPGQMGNWVVASQQGTAATAPVAEFVTGAAAPLGDGFFHMQTKYSDSNPLCKIHFGTNDLSGTPLANITSFKYSTRVRYRDYGGSGDPNGQPPMIELITDSGVDTGTSTWYPQERRFSYKPWGQYGNSHVSLNTWQEWDLMAAGGRWELWGNSRPDYFGNWDWLKNLYRAGTMKVRTPVVGDYMDPLKPANPNDGGLQIANQSGTSVTIRIGSGRAIDSSGYGDGAWWRESCAINADVDKLTIGINGVETTYDFEPALLPTVVIRGNNALEPIMNAARANFKFTVFGKIIDSDYFSYITVDDGSDRTIKVLAQDFVGAPGAFVRATGLLNNQTDPPTLASTAAQVEVLADPT